MRHWWGHKWVPIEQIGAVVTYRCAICGRQKLRVE
jgi:hypothetical protein